MAYRLRWSTRWLNWNSNSFISINERARLCSKYYVLVACVVALVASRYDTAMLSKRCLIKRFNALLLLCLNMWIDGSVGFFKDRFLFEKVSFSSYLCDQFHWVRVLKMNFFLRVRVKASEIWFGRLCFRLNNNASSPWW